MAYTVELTKFIDKMNLELLTPDVNVNEILVSQTDVNRPALQLAGFFDYFDSNRIQVIGQVEYTYMEKMEKDTREECWNSNPMYLLRLHTKEELFMTARVRCAPTPSFG